MDAPDLEARRIADERLEQVSTTLKAYFRDFVVIASQGNGAFQARYTDTTWALGACNRLTNTIQGDDLDAEGKAG